MGSIVGHDVRVPHAAAVDTQSCEADSQGPPRTPPSLVAPKADPPPLNSKSSIARRCPMSWAFPNGANFGWNSPNRGVACRDGPAPQRVDGAVHGYLFV
jgi:hypothetical protein